MAARTGKAKLAGVIGFPVGHSLSPALHEYWLRTCDIDGAYIPLAVPSGAFSETLRALSTLGFQGINVTIPYKEQAFESASECDDAATITGAVNTLIRKADGSWSGSNTDVSGFVASLEHHGIEKNSVEKALVLGAGGAARAIVAGLAQLGCRDITVSNRTPERAEQLCTTITPQVTASLHTVLWEERDVTLSDTQLLINTTQLGMQGQPALELDISALPRDAAVVDIIYNPLETPLLKDAAASGHTTINGLWMLIYQAVPGFEAWYGTRPEVTQELYDYLTSRLGV